MELTKTETGTVKTCIAHLTRKFSINGMAKEQGKNVSLIHRAATSLLEKKVLIKDSHNLLSLDYTLHPELLAYVESIRKDEFFAKGKHKELILFTNEVLSKIKNEYLIVVLFGSAVVSNKPHDYDVLFIFSSEDQISRNERALDVIASHYKSVFDLQLVTTASISEMAAKRNQKNIFNEMLDKHIILAGAENFYRLLHHVRQ